MHERYLYDVLQSGVARMKADRAIFDDLFSRELELADAEVEEIWSFWQAKTPAVHHSYPRRDFVPPFYSLALGIEGEDEKWVGNAAGMIDDPDDPRYGEEIFSSGWSHQYRILCITEHPDATLYIYNAAKYILSSANDLWVEKGWYRVMWSGMDLEPDPRYMPEHWLVRELRVSFGTEFLRVDSGSALGKAWRVGGIHLDGGGAPGEDTGGVKTLVTVQATSEE